MSYKFEKPFHICNLSSHWALSNCCDPLRESLHTPMIKITYASTHMLYFYTWKIASTSIHPSTNKTPCCIITISLQNYHKIVWAIQKEIKDADPKKICHMPTRHVKKKEREKMHTQRRYASCLQGMTKRKGRRKSSPYKKYYKGERNHMKESLPSSTKNFHTLAHLDQGI